MLCKLFYRNLRFCDYNAQGEISSNYRNSLVYSTMRPSTNYLHYSPSGHRLGRSTITVQIQSTPTWAHDSVVEAMTTWNEAQVWFRNTYYQNSSVFNLVEGSQGDAIVSFTKNEITCVGSVGMGGCTTWRNGAGQTRTIIDTVWGASYTNYLALHELGRILGLGTSSYIDQLNGNPDIMSENHDGQPAISTLDLYGLHLQALQNSASSATLPQSIPYMAVPSSALPEFSFTPFVIVLNSLLGVLLLRARQRKRRPALH